MSKRDIELFHRTAFARMAEAGERACNAPDAEASLSGITEVLFEILGDRNAHERPGALKEGERQFFVSGIFLVLPNESGHLLVAENGFPPEQHRLRIPIVIAHPGWVYRNRVPLILANTDEHAGFAQILKTARMGSALYGPMLWQGQMVGQLVMAAQARNTFSEIDLEVLVAYTQLATAAFVASEGVGWLQDLASSL
ncbi:MAG TPA: GAF domain-containing protein [Woeseiaceae bacterium]|nr:GAF domain-containing protein [Woeseiaceae bacterium]